MWTMSRLLHVPTNFHWLRNGDIRGLEARVSLTFAGIRPHSLVCMCTQKG